MEEHWLNLQSVQCVVPALKERLTGSFVTFGFIIIMVISSFKGNREYSIDVNNNFTIFFLPN